MPDAPDKDAITTQVIGRTFGACTVTEKIATGGFGTVFKAEDARLGVPRAIKIFHPHLASEKSFRARFEAEVRTLAQLDHPNIVRILFTLDDPDVIGYVMEYVPGKTLKRLTKDMGHLPPAKIVEIGAQIAEAVHHAHTLPNPVVHRDLSPENVLVRPDGVVKVTDFGIAKVLGEEAVTYTGAVVGKPRYMSPEQFEGFVSASCDIYALGVILYEIATGRPPYDASTHVSYYLKHRDTAPAAPSLANPDLPWKLERTILRALAKRPAQRFESMRAVADDLRLIDALQRAGPALLTGEADRKAQACLAQGFALFEEGSFDAAITAFQQVGVHDPGSTVAAEWQDLALKRSTEKPLSARQEDEVSGLVRKGLAAHQAHRFHEAIECFTKVLELRKDHEEAQKCLKLSQDKLAAQRRETQLERPAAPPATAPDFYNEGMRLLEESDYESAEGAFARALDLDPDHDLARTNREVARLRRRERAADDRATTERKNEIRALLADGTRLFETGHFADARKRFLDILALEPLHPDARKHRILCEERLLGEEKAKEREAAGLRELFQKGLEALARGDFRRALADFGELVNLAPDHEEARARLAEASAGLGRLEAENQLLLDQADKLAFDGAFEDAVSSLEAVLKRDPQNETARLKLAQTRTHVERRKKEAELKQMFDDAMRLLAAGAVREARTGFAKVLRMDHGHKGALEGMALCDQRLASLPPPPPPAAAAAPAAAPEAAPAPPAPTAVPAPSSPPAPAATPPPPAGLPAPGATPAGRSPFVPTSPVPLRSPSAGAPPIEPPTHVARAGPPAPAAAAAAASAPAAGSAPAAPPAEAAPAADAARPETTPTLRPSAPLIARLREMTLLDRALDATTRGAGAAFVLSGEAGLGKTRLLREFVAANNFRSCLFLEGSFPGDLSLPLSGLRPLVQSAFEKIESTAREPAVRFLTRWGTGLSKFVGRLRDRVLAAGARPALDTPNDRAVELLFSFMMDVAAWRPVVLCLDRVELADRYSVEAIRALAAAAKRQPLLLCAAYEAAKETEGNPFARLLPDLRREGLVTDLPLPVFSKVDLEAYFRSSLKWEKPSAPLLAEILRLTGGNPGKVERILAWLLEHKLLTLEGGDWHVSGNAGDDLDLALGLTETLIPRYRTLTRKHQAVLQAAAVYGRPVSFKILREVSGLTDTELYYILNDLVAEKMLLERPEKGQSLYGVMTPKLRDHVVGTLTAEERERVHERVGRSLEKALAELPEATVDEIADHFLQTASADKAAEYCMKAGARLARAGRNREALERFSKVLDLAPRLRAREVPAEALERLALVNARMGRGDLALRQLGDSQAAAPRKGERAYELNRGLGLVYLLVDRYVESGRHLELAVNALGRAARKEEVEISLAQARLALAREELAKATELFKTVEGRAAAAAPAREDALAAARLGLAQVAFVTGEPAKVAAGVRDVLGILDRREDLELRAEALLLAARVALLRYDRTEAPERAGEAAEVARTMPDPGIEARALFASGSYLARTGQVLKARDTLSLALELARKIDRTVLVGLGDLHLAWFFMAAEDVEKGLEHGTEALMHFERIGYRSGTAAAGVVLGRAHLLRGALDKAGPLLAGAVATLEKIGVRFGLAGAQVALADLFLRKDDLAAAEALLPKAIENAGRFEDVYTLAQAHRLTALAHARRRRLNQANTWFVKCLQALEKAADPWAQAEASLRYAQFLLDTKPAAGSAPHALAMKHAKVAADEFGKLGLPAWKKRAEAELGRARS